jgi:hypothetical protein
VSPEEDNTQQRQGPQDPSGKGEALPEKFQGKSAAEIARMYEELESRFGTMGNELGHLRATLQEVVTAKGQEREPAGKDEYVSRYSRFADDLLINPEKALPELVAEVKREILAETSRVASGQVTAAQQIEGFFRTNPDLDQYREIVSVIGERIYQANPNAPLASVLERTAQEARTYLASLEARITGRKKQDADRVRAGMTTGGGGRTREGTDAEAGGAGESGPRDEKDKVLDAIRELQQFRAKRIVPPSATPASR